eukprot:scaffold42044_cov70-Phaeocystis_antarctica.AAC.2
MHRFADTSCHNAGLPGRSKRLDKGNRGVCTVRMTHRAVRTTTVRPRREFRRTGNPCLGT